MDAIDSNGIPYVVGARVVAVAFIERYPDFKLPPGTTGTISEIDGDAESPRGTIRVLVDLPWRHLITDPEHEFKVDCYGGFIGGAQDEDGRHLTAGEVAAREWVVTSLPGRGDLPRPLPQRATMRAVAMEAVDYMIDNLEPGGTERSLLEIVARGDYNEGIVAYQLRKAHLVGAGEDPATVTRLDTLLARIDPHLREFARGRLGALPPEDRTWRAVGRYTITVQIATFVQAPTEGEARTRAAGAVESVGVNAAVKVASGFEIVDESTEIVDVTEDK